MAFDNNAELKAKAQQAIWDKNTERRKLQLESVMNSKDGRAVLALLFQKLEFRGDIPTDNSTKTSYLIGRRSVAVELFRDIKNYGLYDLYQLLEKEDVELQQLEELEAKKIVEQYQKRS